MSRKMCKAAQTALDIQNACNSSGVIFALTDVMRVLCDEIPNTRARNAHPIVTLFLLKLTELNGCGSTLNPAYASAEAECKRLAGMEVAA